MHLDYKKKILQEIEKVPEDKIVGIYKIIHLLTKEITSEAKKAGKRISLKDGTADNLPILRASVQNPKKY